MKGQFELSNLLLEIMSIMLICIFLVGIILTLIEFRAIIDSSTSERTGIDFGENVLSTSCLVESKGLFVESKLDDEKTYSEAHPDDLDGLSCLKTSFLTATKIGIENKEWIIKDEFNQNIDIFKFPAAVKKTNGEIVPATLTVQAKLCDADCYYCLTKEECENANCVWFESYGCSHY